MRNWIIAVAACMLSLPASAQDVALGAGSHDAPEPVAEVRDACHSLSRIAEHIMRARLNGYPMRDAMQTAAGSPDGLRDLVESLVVAAYKEPDFQSPKVQAAAITEFGNRAYLSCRGT